MAILKTKDGLGEDSPEKSPSIALEIQEKLLNLDATTIPCRCVNTIEEVFRFHLGGWTNKCLGTSNIVQN